MEHEYCFRYSTSGQLDFWSLTHGAPFSATTTKHEQAGSTLETRGSNAAVQANSGRHSLVAPAEAARADAAVQPIDGGAAASVAEPPPAEQGLDIQLGREIVAAAARDGVPVVASAFAMRERALDALEARHEAAIAAAESAASISELEAERQIESAIALLLHRAAQNAPRKDEPPLPATKPSPSHNVKPIAEIPSSARTEALASPTAEKPPPSEETSTASAVGIAERTAEAVSPGAAAAVGDRNVGPVSAKAVADPQLARVLDILGPDVGKAFLTIAPCARPAVSATILAIVGKSNLVDTLLCSPQFDSQVSGRPVVIHPNAAPPERVRDGVAAPVGTADAVSYSVAPTVLAAGVSSADADAGAGVDSGAAIAHVASGIIVAKEIGGSAGARSPRKRARPARLSLSLAGEGAGAGAIDDRHVLPFEFVGAADLGQDRAARIEAGRRSHARRSSDVGPRETSAAAASAASAAAIAAYGARSSGASGASGAPSSGTPSADASAFGPLPSAAAFVVAIAKAALPGNVTPAGAGAAAAESEPEDIIDTDEKTGIISAKKPRYTDPDPVALPLAVA
jgi:hypothetical protein